MLQRALVVSLTRTIRGNPAEVRFGIEDGLPTECVANLFEINSVRLESLGRLVAVVKPHRWEEVKRALLFATGFEDWLDA